MPEDLSTHHNSAETMRDIMAEISHHDPVETPPALDLTRAHLVTLPTHRNIENLTQHHRAALEFLKPARRTGTAQLKDLDSLILWANRFKGDTSAMFANPDMAAPKLTCIADYHAAGPIDPIDPAGDATARHCHHRAIYSFPLSKEWDAWMAISGRALDKDEMGEFIESNAKDIADPTPAVLSMVEKDSHQPWENRLIATARQIEGRYGQLGQLLAMSRRFQVYETSDLTVKTNRDTGESEIQFLNEHKDADGKPLSVPNLIIITIPVFLNGAPYRMPVRFRYRKAGSAVKFILSVYNPEKVFDAAFDEALNIAREATDLPIFQGSPEA
ncbi:hypothetical protein AL035_02010 [Salipiger aestuarii]|uniref:Uncharacterized protein DUF2303 n=1 Tax=Salipiger aestuarii TaxID=568098 RepID=A0A327YSY9_9RHOB|nr:DUF2303 family protein [Salipiger aestuarii]KAB2543263.1 hypothetical protein AL035_02010 [Salipiger aestuarii]RAK24080.1 uncharacterized protein DUF2303 [Salipiger aestuarii]